MASGKTAFIIVACGLLAACSREAATPAGTASAPAMPERAVTMEVMMQGAGLYQEHCAQCHGPDAQGHPDWQNPEVAAAPPLNGTGNEWKRSRAELVAVIRNGLTRNKEPVMPGWGNRLSDSDIDALITWFQALWPNEVYDKWQKVNTAPPAAAKKG
jgi:mono/diheme cytochrome c family protein